MHRLAPEASDFDVLNQALEFVHVGTWTYDIAKDEVKWSDELYRLVGLEPQSLELTYKTYLRYIHPDDRARVEETVANAFATGSSFQLDTRMLRADGTVRYHLARGHAFTGASGKVVRLSGASLDITDRVQQQEALRLSEERFRRLFDQAAVGFITANADGIIQSANKSFEEFIGYTADELVGQTIHSIQHPDDRTLMGNITHRHESTSVTFDKRYIRKGGKEVWGRATVTRLSGEANGPDVFMGLVQDISEARVASAQLLAQKELLQTVMDNLPIMVSMFDQDDTPIFVNKEWTRILGWTLADLRKMDFVAALYPDPQERQRATDAVQLAEGKWADFEPTSRSGRKVETAWTCLRISDGTMLTIGQDTTAIRAMRQRLAQSEKMEAIGQLAGGIAHDFNNLLTVISTCATFLKEEVADAGTAMEDITEILAASSRAAALTGQLLAFSRQQILTPVVVDVNEAVNQVTKSLTRLLPESISLATLPRARFPRVEADANQLQQVLLNLAVNARDAMPEGGLITIETSNSPNVGKPTGTADVVITVTDTGYGISPDVKDRIFDPFFTTKAVGKGTGLGLATVHGIVEQSGGRIEVDSTVGEGSVFRVILPGTIREDEDDLDWGADSPQMHTETVLLVEDESSLRQVARRILASRGYTVLEARHGADALRVSHEYAGPIHLLVTDIVMPEMGGRELAVKIRESRPGIPVLFMSGYTDDELMRRGVFEEATSLLRKPFLPIDLANAASNLLRVSLS